MQNSKISELDMNHTNTSNIDLLNNFFSSENELGFLMISSRFKSNEIGVFSYLFLKVPLGKDTIHVI